MRSVCISKDSSSNDTHNCAEIGPDDRLRTKTTLIACVGDLPTRMIILA